MGELFKYRECIQKKSIKIWLNPVLEQRYKLVQKFHISKEMVIKMLFRQ